EPEEDLDVDRTPGPARADAMEIMVVVERGAQFPEDDKLELFLKGLVEEIREGGGDLPVPREKQEPDDDKRKCRIDILRPAVLDEENRQYQRKEDQHVGEGLGPPEPPLGLHDRGGILLRTPVVFLPVV